MKLSIILPIFAALILGYIGNIVRLCRCDFEPSYKAEIIRGVGILVPPLGTVAFWFDIGPNNE